VSIVTPARKQDNRLEFPEAVVAQPYLVFPAIYDCTAGAYPGFLRAFQRVPLRAHSFTHLRSTHLATV
jgi:hypothetical protein